MQFFRSSPWAAGANGARAAGPHLALILASLLVAGCAFDDGQPWARAQFDVEAAFQPSADRLDEGLLITSSDYRVDVQTLTVELAEAQVRVAAGGEAGAFDPADPPEGYSLCHNGHCHSDSGELVDYEDIAVEQAGGDFVATQLLSGELDVNEQADSPRLEQCSDECRLPRGELTLVGTRLTTLRVAGVVTDPVERLAEPLEFDVDLTLDVLASKPVTGEVGPGEPVDRAFSIQFEVPAEMFDGIDFSTTTDFSEQLAANIAEHARLKPDN